VKDSKDLPHPVIANALAIETYTKQAEEDKREP